MQSDGAVSLIDIVQQFPWAMLLVRTDLRLVWSSQMARKMLDQPLGLSLVDGAVDCGDAAATRRLRMLVASADEDFRQQLLAMPNGPSLFLRYRKFGPSGDLVGLIVHPVENYVSIDVDAIASVYKLTPTEKVVVECILSGHPPADMAAKLGISVLTVRTHLKHIYTKLGVCNREAFFVICRNFAKGPTMEEFAELFQ